MNLFHAAVGGVPRRAGPALESLKRLYEQAVRGLQGDEMNNGECSPNPVHFLYKFNFFEVLSFGQS